MTSIKDVTTRTILTTVDESIDGCLALGIRWFVRVIGPFMICTVYNIVWRFVTPKNTIIKKRNQPYPPHTIIINCKNR